ncbi:hypothetical protein Bbelb_169300 [Branchiostoma belcheri]|nr:hypothetical protein Bbelb_169300 [Branchiostoma belcheri]
MTSFYGTTATWSKRGNNTPGNLLVTDTGANKLERHCGRTRSHPVSSADPAVSPKRGHRGTCPAQLTRALRPPAGSILRQTRNFSCPHLDELATSPDKGRFAVI